MKRKIIYIAVSAMLIAGTVCTSAFAATTTTAVTAKATSSSTSGDTAKPEAPANMLMGKVTAIADGTLTLETMGGGMGGPNGSGNTTSLPEKPDGTGSTSSIPPEKPADSSAAASDGTTATQPKAETKTVTLTSSTVYYKETSGTATDGKTPEIAKANATASDVTADSMVKIEYEENKTTGALTAVLVTIMDSSMMNNKPAQTTSTSSK